MKQGKVCEKHQEFSPDGECRWCEPPPSEAFLALAEKLDVVDFTAPIAPFIVHYGNCPFLNPGGVCRCNGASPLPAWPLPDPNIGPPRNQQPPLPVASCKHDGVLYDYGGTTSCAACGKVLSAPVKPPCEMLQTTHTMATCGAASAWRWVAESGAALAAPKKEYFFCDFHGKSPVGGWRADPTT